MTERLTEFQKGWWRAERLAVIREVRGRKRLVQIVESFSIARNESGEHLEVETRGVVVDRDDALKEGTTEMLELDGSLQALVHLDAAERLFVSSANGDKGRVEPFAKVVAHLFGINAVHAHRRAEVVPMHFSAMLEQPVLRKTSGVGLRQVD